MWSKVLQMGRKKNGIARPTFISKRQLHVWFFSFLFFLLQQTLLVTHFPLPVCLLNKEEKFSKAHFFHSFIQPKGILINIKYEFYFMRLNSSWSCKFIAFFFCLLFFFSPPPLLHQYISFEILTANIC